MLKPFEATVAYKGKEQDGAIGTLPVAAQNAEHAKELAEGFSMLPDIKFIVLKVKEVTEPKILDSYGEWQV